MSNSPFAKSHSQGLALILKTPSDQSENFPVPTLLGMVGLGVNGHLLLCSCVALNTQPARSAKEGARIVEETMYLDFNKQKGMCKQSFCPTSSSQINTLTLMLTINA